MCLKKHLFLTLLIVFVTQILSAQVSEESNELRIKVELISSMPSLRLQGEPVCCSNTIPQFYNQQLFQSIWNAEMTNQLIKVIEESSLEGLNPMDYHLEQQQKLQQQKELSIYEKTDFEILQTDAFLLYTSHLMSGKVDPQKIDSDWKVSKREGNPLIVLETVMQNGNVSEEIEKIKPSFKS